AALSVQEVENLFATVRRLRERGVAVLFISHRLQGIRAIAAGGTALRDGRHVVPRPAPEVSHGELIRLMVGRSLEALFPKEEAEIGDVVLRAEGLTQGGVFSTVSFEVRRGEIVGLAGFVGAGRTEVARAVFGIDRLDPGRLLIDGRASSPPPLLAARAAVGAPRGPRLSARGPPPAGADPADVGGAERLARRAAVPLPRRRPAALAGAPARPPLPLAA